MLKKENCLKKKSLKIILKVRVSSSYRETILFMYISQKSFYFSMY